LGTNSKPDEEWGAVEAILGPALTAEGWAKAVQRFQPGSELIYTFTRNGREAARLTFLFVPDRAGSPQRRWMARAGAESLFSDRRYHGGTWWQSMARDAYIALRELDSSLPMGLLALQHKASRASKGSRAGWLRHNMKAPRCLCGELIEDAPRGARGEMARCVCGACGARLVLADQTEPRWSLRVACVVPGCLEQVVTTDGRCGAHAEEVCGSC
jgi:hypothetical protein